MKKNYYYIVNAKHKIVCENYCSREDAEILAKFSGCALYDHFPYKEYGYEDTCFGFELKERGIAIHHIDNKLTHLGIETSNVYLAKIETALRTLSKIDKEQRKLVRLSGFAMKLERYCLLGLVRYVFRLTKTQLRANLLGKHPNQKLFTFYKLGYYADLMP